MDDAKSAIRATLSQVKTFLAQEGVPRLSEADTKANFIEPIVAALGWSGIGVVTREYYVKNSQEFIDYVMGGPAGRLLAIEAKPLQSDLTDKYAAQLIQYCAVEGIEWAALTNGRELQFFNTFLKPDLAAKRILSLDLLAFNDDEEFDGLFTQIWQLSRERMSTPTAVRSWLNQRRLDAALRAILVNPGSSTLRQLRKTLADAEVSASTQDLAQWFGRHLGAPITPLLSTEQRSGQGAAKAIAEELAPLSAGTDVMRAEAGATFDAARAHGTGRRSRRYYGVRLGDLVCAGLLQAGATLVLVAKGNREVARAILGEEGEIVWDGKAYRSPSDDAFAPLLGVTKFNGWAYWHAELPDGLVPLSDIRVKLIRADSPNSTVRIDGVA